MHQSLREQMGRDGTEIYSTQLFATEQDLKLEIFLSVGQQCYAHTTSTAMRIQQITILVLIAFNRLNQSAHTRSIAMNLRVVAPDLESDSSALLSSNPTSRSISNHDSLHSSSSNESSSEDSSTSVSTSSSAINSASDSSTARSSPRKRKSNRSARDRAVISKRRYTTQEIQEKIARERFCRLQRARTSTSGTAQLHSFGLG